MKTLNEYLESKLDEQQRGLIGRARDWWTDVRGRYAGVGEAQFNAARDAVVASLKELQTAANRVKELQDTQGNPGFFNTNIQALINKFQARDYNKELQRQGGISGEQVPGMQKTQLAQKGPAPQTQLDPQAQAGKKPRIGFGYITRMSETNQGETILSKARNNLKKLLIQKPDLENKINIGLIPNKPPFEDKSLWTKTNEPTLRAFVREIRKEQKKAAQQTATS